MSRRPRGNHWNSLAWRGDYGLALLPGDGNQCTHRVNILCSADGRASGFAAAS
jgi:hypothetical protein